MKPRAWRAHEEGSPTQYLSARAGGETTGYRSDDQLHRLSYLRPPRKRGWVKRTFIIDLNPKLCGTHDVVYPGTFVYVRGSHVRDSHPLIPHLTC